MKCSIPTHQRDCYLEPTVSQNNTESESVFKLLEISKSQSRLIACDNTNYLLCVETGQVEIISNKHGIHTFKKKEMVLIEKGSTVTIRGIAASSKILTVNCLDLVETKNIQMNSRKYADIKDQTVYNFRPTALNTILHSCIESIIGYLTRDVTCAKLLGLKTQEIAICIEYYYTAQQIVQLFHPIIARDSSFKEFVMQHYSQVNSVMELVEISNMGKTAFYEKFNVEFGVTAKQWMLKQKLILIKQEITTRPDARVKEVFTHFGFNSHKHFYIFCKRHFNCSPTSLRIKQEQLLMGGDSKYQS